MYCTTICSPAYHENLIFPEAGLCDRQGVGVWYPRNDSPKFEPFDRGGIEYIFVS
ncbi:hypothetical protein [Oscillatoria sp. HE19RPO]|uniref:hypothetical protein n=1 Tax=Oscillatoria sp. HE19RPO TaxID=2954806 RepID=UPI0020C30BE1|nr:hypothetical protein [Oscillatoria sp. HE19RPO]